MSDTEPEADDEPKKKSKLPLILGLVLALAGGGGSFFAVYSGMILGGSDSAEDAPADVPERARADVAFVPIDPITIGLGAGRAGRHLRFRAQLEVPSAALSEVEKLAPRVVDVMNTYLRAVDVRDLEDASALVRLRAQLLRRVQAVTGPGRVNDLLIMEFVVT